MEKKRKNKTYLCSRYRNHVSSCCSIPLVNPWPRLWKVKTTYVIFSKCGYQFYRAGCEQIERCMLIVVLQGKVIDYRFGSWVFRECIRAKIAVCTWLCAIAIMWHVRWLHRWERGSTGAFSPPLFLPINRRQCRRPSPLIPFHQDCHLIVPMAGGGGGLWISRSE